MEKTFKMSFSIGDDDHEDPPVLRRPKDKPNRPSSGIESSNSLHRFSSTCSLNFQNTNFFRRSIRDIKQLVQKNALYEASLPPNGARRKNSGRNEEEEEMTASNMSLNNPKKSFFSRLKRKTEAKKLRKEVRKDEKQFSSQCDLRNDGWKNTFAPSSLKNTSTSPQPQEFVIHDQVKDTSTLINPSVLMPPPTTCYVPVSMANNNKTYNRRNSCFEVVSNSSLDEASSSSVSSNNNQFNNNNKNNLTNTSQSDQPSFLKGFFRGKLMNNNLARSQSDSQKKCTLKFNSSNRSLSSENFPVQKRSSENVSLSDSKTSNSTSEVEGLHTLPEENSGFQPILHSEEEGDVEIPSTKLYSNFEEVLNQRNRLSIFLHFLLSHSNPVPLLFFLLLEAYTKAGSKDQARWAYELYSSFIHPSAPLRLSSDIDSSVIEAIMSNKVEKEDLGGLFEGFRGHAIQMCNDLLNTFRNKLTMGLGSLYGEQHTDSASIHNLILQHLSDLRQKTDDKSVLLSASLQTYMRLVGWQETVKGPSFFHKEKSKSLFSKYSKKTSRVIQDHHFYMHQFTCTHHCQLCTHLVHGVSSQAFLCLRCEQAFHKECVEKLGMEQRCNGGKKVDRAKTTSGIIIRKKNSKNAKGKQEEGDSEANLPRTVSLMSFKDTPAPKHFPKHKSQRDERDQTDHGISRLKQVRSLHFDNQLTSQTSLATFPSLPQSNQPNNFYLGYNSPSYLSDSEIELQSETPTLEELYGKEVVKKMKPKDKKRQNVIIELMHTERTHVRNLKVMHNLIHLPIAANFPPTFTTLIFPNLPDLISVHDELKHALKERLTSKQGHVIPSITDILFLHFTGEKQMKLMQECASFCEKQSQALDALRTKQRKEPKLAALLQEAQSNPLCRRFELKDLLPTVMQRLTKYPLLISNIIKHTQDGEEVRELERALDGSRDVLANVNSVVRRYHNHLKLVNMQRRLEIKNQEVHTVMNQYQDLDLRKHSLLHEGDMTWRLNREKQSDVRVLLLQDVLLLLLKQDEKLVLKCQSTIITTSEKRIHCPIIPLNNLLVKLSASEDKAFFLVSHLKETQPQVYDLLATSSDDKKKWCRHIEQAVEAYKLDHPAQPTLLHKTPSSPSTISLPHTSTSIPPPSVTRSSTIPSSHHSTLHTTHQNFNKLTYPLQNRVVVGGSEMNETKMDERVDGRMDGNQMDGSRTDTEEKSHLIEKLHKIDGTIEELMKEKWGLIEELAEDNGEDRENDVGKDENMDGGLRDGGLEDIEWLLKQVEWLLKQVQKDNDGGEGDGEKRGEGEDKSEIENREIKEENTFRSGLEKDFKDECVEDCIGVAHEKQQLLMKALKIQKKMHSLTLHLQPTHHPPYSHSSIQPIPILSKHSPTPPPINSSTHPENHHDVPTKQPLVALSTNDPSVANPQDSININNNQNDTDDNFKINSNCNVQIHLSNETLISDSSI